MKTEKLLKGLESYKIYGNLPAEIKKITDVWQESGKESLFFLRKGNNTDVNDLALKAENRGAAIIVSENFFECKTCLIVVEDVVSAMASVAGEFYGVKGGTPLKVGVVGTNGKTSTCHYLSRILEKSGKKTAVIGTVGNDICGERQDTELTTPGLIKFYELLSLAKRKGADFFISELSAHAIVQRRIEGIVFDVLIFTNCTEDHLDYFGTFNSYAAVKESAFDEGKRKIALVNVDDPLGLKISRKFDKNVFTYGIVQPADAFAADIKESKYGVECLFDLFCFNFPVKTGLVGRFNVYNLLAASACALLLGEEPRVVSDGVNEVKSVEGRLERSGKIRGAEIFIDYAHTPDGLEKSLSAMRNICSGKLVSLFGCGGNREKEKRKIMGGISARLADFTVVTDDNPRYELPEEIRSEIVSGIIEEGGNYAEIADRKGAIEYAIGLLGDGDVLLVAGKGAENYMESNGKKYDYSDKKTICEYLSRRGEKD